MATTETCPQCGGPTGFGCGPGYLDYREPGDTTGVCLAMNLTRNHCIYFGRMLSDPTYQRDRCPCYRNHAWNSDCARETLRRCIARAREVWPAEHLNWLPPYLELAEDPTAPDHACVPTTEQEALL